MTSDDVKALIEDVEYHLGNWDGDYVERGCDLIKRLAAALSALSHAETEAEWEYGVRATGDEEPYTDVSDDLDWLLDHALAIEDDEIVRRRKAGEWEVV